jgi:catechol 2,3-dioxygenase-like lactoylglutathione lyase family enzyme
MSWVREVSAVTLFVDDLEAAREFYLDVFELPVHVEDPHSVVFLFGGLMVNLLREEAVPELIDPAPMAPTTAGVRAQLTVRVDDVEQVCARLAERGVALVNGPQVRPWGPTTACFRDPAGHLWEMAS